jgi:hypothetical protein
MKKIIGYLYPFLFTIYPILALRNFNITYVDTASVIRPLVLSIVFTGMMWALLRVIVRNWDKAGIIVTIAIILFFSYGHIFLQIESKFDEAIRHRYLIMIFAGVLILLGGSVIWKVKNTEGIVNFLSLMGILMIAFSLFQSAQYDISIYQAAKTADELQNATMEQVSNTDTLEKPDIYLILLDGYTRSDILKENYNFDNSAFLQELEERGFYVAECAQSNYPSTKLSVTSVFYAKYHDLPYLSPVSSSVVVETVRSLGYQVMTFENRSNGHFDINEDVRLSRNTMAFGRVDLTGGLSEFEMMLLQTSMLRLAYDMPQLFPGLNTQLLHEAEYYEHYHQVKFILSELQRIPEIDGPKLVFAHILVPHPPFIFSPEGEFTWAEDRVSGYNSNVQFIDSQIVPVVDAIIAKSKVPPVIIIMGDHGPFGSQVTPEMRLSILNAYYVNDEAKQDLYAEITPINSFRVVFNNYFGTNYPLLEDKSYFSYEMDKFTPDKIIPNTCQATP